MKCEDELGATEKIRWSKVNAMGIVKWGAKISHDGLYKSSRYQNYSDTHQHFDVSETTRSTIPIHTN